MSEFLNDDLRCLRNDGYVTQEGAIEGKLRFLIFPTETHEVTNIY